MTHPALLINRKINLNQGKVNWYSALEYLRKYPSISQVDFYDTCSSAGDWQGYLVQKINGRSYLILFSQENNWPRSGYTVYTGEVVMEWQGDITGDEILSLIQEHIEMYNA